MNRHLAQLKTRLKNEAIEETDITDRRSFVSSVRAQSTRISNNSRASLRGGLQKEVEQIRSQEIADERNRNAEILNITDRFCACGLIATLEWPDGARFKRVWRCERCADQ